MRKHLFLFLLLLPLVSVAQTISTIAGNGTAGYAGDSGPATAAEFSRPVGLAIDQHGNIYVADYNNQCVRKIDAAGVITTIAGNDTAGFSGDGGPATAAELNGPAAIAIDGAGNIYIADCFNQRVRKIDASGIINTIAGNGTNGFAGDGGPATAAEFSYPEGICLNLGSLYIVDQVNYRIRMVDTAGVITTIAGNGTSATSGDGGPATAASLALPENITTDDTGNIYFSDVVSMVVRKINVAGIISTVAGDAMAGAGFSGDGGPATAAQMYEPVGVKVANGCIYIADGSDNRIRMVNRAGIINTIAGTGTAGFGGDGGPALLAELDRPADILFDDTGYLLIADQYNERVRKFRDLFLAFTGGAIQFLPACANTPVYIDRLMTANDTSVGVMDKWTVITAPAHGALGGFPASDTATGGSVVPSGLTYTAMSGYLGPDTFRIQVSNGIDSTITTVAVTVDSTLDPIYFASTNIRDQFCFFDPATYAQLLVDATPGGVWSSIDTNIAMIDSTGLLTLDSVWIVSGSQWEYYDTILYTLPNGCSATIAVLASGCDGIAIIPNTNEISIFPNPAATALTIQSSKVVISEASITNTLGQEVYNRQFAVSSLQCEVDVSGLPPGVYFVKVRGPDSYGEVSKFVKE